MRVLGEIPAAALRRRYYLESDIRLERLPPRFRRRLGLEDTTAVGSRRIEIGSGSRPQPGYIHVDISLTAAHVEFFGSADSLPFRSDWAEEITAVHVLEHVHPSRLRATLGEWHRVLEPGGLLRVHVPDSAALMRLYLDAPLEKRWSIIGALLGMYANPSVARPEDLSHGCDHQVLFDAMLLSALLRDAGFEQVMDVSDEVRDIHSDGWVALMPQISLIMEARTPSRLIDRPGQ
jgi:SAM-dependent methyltransferase